MDEYLSLSETAELVGKCKETLRRWDKEGIQTFPDEWKFEGSISQQYKQIGNAVPVNLAKELGYSIITFLNNYYLSKNQIVENS